MVFYNLITTDTHEFILRMDLILLVSITLFIFIIFLRLHLCSLKDCKSDEIDLEGLICEAMFLTLFTTPP